MTDSRPDDPTNVERRRSPRRLSWLFGRQKKGSETREQFGEETLSRVLSRSRLTAVAAETLALAARTREAVVCTLIEVRGLRRVNHAVGPEVGDDDKETAVVALGSVFRRSDILARWADNSFVVLSVGPGPESDDVERRMTEQLQVPGEGDLGALVVNVSAGRVVHMPWQDEDLDQIVERANQELLRQSGLRRARDGDQDFDEL